MTQISESDIPPGEPGDTGRLLDAMLAVKAARVHDGPVKGTRVISIEIPPDAENFDMVDSLYTACRNISSSLFPEAFITAYTIMEGKGKHGGNSASVRGESNPG